MADYREISQQYAQEGIKAAAVLNGGAAIALLTQTADLLEKGYGQQVADSLELWAAGLTASAVTWIIAFLSTRHVDRSEEPGRNREKELLTSDRYMLIGLLLFCVSIGFFVWGACALSSNLGHISAAPSTPTVTLAAPSP
ncbi:hypothetical protein [Paracoccus sp. (in: a-proteobacteria)]|uniref:hypothetical protein n=1 Tax=Paracoccus sp. TaxID=267 RepID=UPI002AFFA895|nr:hypothetical protein [Paracoccus sp. (in: a-proteobacteria)]